MPDATPDKEPIVDTLRPAQVGDLDDIVTIENGCFREERYEREWLDEYLQASLASPRTSLIMAFSKAASDTRETVAGYGLGDFANRTTGQIVSMGVAKEARGRHLGRKLLDQVCENLRKAGAEKIILQVETTNQVAINLYESSGFHTTRKLKDYYGPHRDAHLMVKEYGPAKPKNRPTF